jgi:hypothetical protein
MSVRRATPYYVAFAAVDPANRPTRKSGLAFGAGECQVSKDGSSFADTTNSPAEIGATGRYVVLLTVAEMDAGTVHVKVSDPAMDETDVVLFTSGTPTGIVQTDGGNSPTQFKTNRSEATTDFWKDALILLTSGSLAGQIKKCSGYNGGTKILTVASAFTGTPGVGDYFAIINL